MSELKVGVSYTLSFPISNVTSIYKLVANHNVSQNHQIAHTFLDSAGFKVMITKGLIKNMNVSEWRAPPSINRSNYEFPVTVADLDSIPSPPYMSYYRPGVQPYVYKASPSHYNIDMDTLYS